MVEKRLETESDMVTIEEARLFSASSRCAKRHKLHTNRVNQNVLAFCQHSVATQLTLIDWQFTFHAK